jgi:hypothetical protein
MTELTQEQLAVDRARADELRAVMEGLDRRFPIFAMAGVFESKEEKLLRLALDDAAAPGEIENAGRALIASLRARGVRPEQLTTGDQLATKTAQPQTVSNPGAVRMPWGKYEGLRLDQIDVKYLRWCLWKCAKAEIVPVIRAYLKRKQQS